VAIRSFANKGTEDIYNGTDSKAARKTCPTSIWRSAWRKLDQLQVATRLPDLAVPPGNELEALKRDRVGQHSIRINKQYRVCFRWTTAGVEDVEITDYH
jgi:proteic killer suppression protein